MDFFESLPKNAESYEEFLKDIDGCSKCKLHSTRTNIVPGNGPAPCDVMLIGEGPGADEDEQGLPFVGRSGRLLGEMLASGGINRPDDIYITNIVKCRPPKNRDPEKDEVATCIKYLLRQVCIIKPKILIVVGNPSLKTVLGKDKTITKARGNWVEKDVPYMDEKLKVMPIFHPAFLLRNPSKEKGKPKWITWQDILEIQKVKETLKVKSIFS